jgi:hypothetical protein
MQKLKLSKANSKLQKLAKIAGKSVWSLDLLAGHTCHAAKDCKSCVRNGKIKDGPHTKFRCYAASLEAIYPLTYAAHKYNTELLRNKTAAQITSLILNSLPKNVGIIRLHSSGDFMNKEYFYGCIGAIKATPHINWYAYTKCLPYIKEYVDNFGACDIKHGRLLPNFYVTASYGGKYDSLIDKIQIRSTKVILEEEDAAKSDTLVDTTDSLASALSPNFSLVIHSQQPKGTLAAKIVNRRNFSQKKKQPSYTKI